jgi:predicted TIM-barrel fold metal-dependent hydrolase
MSTRVATLVLMLAIGLSCSDSSSNSMPDEIADDVVVESRPGAWGEHLIIDIHAHIGTFQNFDLSMPTLLGNLERYGVQMALISNIDGANLPGTTGNLDEIESNQATADSVLKYPHLFRGLLWTRPNQSQPIEDFERFLTNPAYDSVFVGLKFHPSMNQFSADSEVVDPYLELCARHGLAAVFHSDPGGNASAERIYASARRHPGVPIILYHMGFFGPHQGTIDVVAESLMNGDADLYLGTAQADPAQVLTAVEELGSERILFGSDAAFFGSRHYEEYEAMIDTLAVSLSPDEFRNVVRDNAIRVFNLSPELFSAGRTR